MGWSGGTFTRIGGSTAWADDRAAGTGIVSGPNGTSDSHDEHDQDLAEGIQQALTRDGQNNPTGDISLNSYKFTNVADGTAYTEIVSVGQIQDCSIVNGGLSTGTGAAYVIGTTNPAVTAVRQGQLITFKAHTDSTSTTPTLQLNNLAARTITKNGGALSVGDIKADNYYIVVYKTQGGNNFDLMNIGD